MMENLSDEQMQMLLMGIRDTYKHIVEKGTPDEQKNLINNLAADEAMLNTLTQMLEKVRNKNSMGMGGRMY